MVFGNSVKGPRALMLIGVICLTTAIVFPDFIHPSAPFGLNLLHFARGVLLGVSIVLIVAAALPILRHRSSHPS